MTALPLAHPAPLGRTLRGLGLAALALLGLVLAGCVGGSFSGPKITQQPQDISAFATRTATFALSVEGQNPLTFQWQRDGVDITGATGFTYTTPVLTLADSGAKFSVRVTNEKGSVTSSQATLTVFGPPVITVQPVAQTAAVGATATFTVTATGESLSYQWRRDDVNIAGATAATYTTAATVAADDGADITVAVSNGAGTLISTPVTLTVPGAATILTQPISQVAAEGEPAYFGVRAQGGGLSYQWRRNGTPIAGATSARYVLPAAALGDDGAAFSVTVTNTLGTATSTDAILAVGARTAAALPARAAEVGTGRTPIAGEAFTVVRKADGTVWSWGINVDGQRGNGTSGNANDTPGQVTLPTGTTAVQLAVGGKFALVRLQNGDVYGWGTNTAGQLGLGDATARTTPTKITLPLPAIWIAAGREHSLAVLNDGTVYAWGLDGSGQLGDGERGANALPTQVAGLTGVASVAAGNDHSLALTTDGRVYAWGNNVSGQVGDGTLKIRRRPVDTGLTGIVAIRAGADSSAAITPKRTLLVWGENGSGQMGRGAGITADQPTPTGVAFDAIDASMADLHLAYVGSDGLVRSAGTNASGEIGDGTTTARTSFAPATGVATAFTASAGSRSFSVAILANGDVYSWGTNAGENLGNAALSATGTSTPTLVPSFDAIP